MHAGDARVLRALIAYQPETAPTIAEVGRALKISNSRARQLVAGALERRAVRIVPRRDGRDGIARRA
jgi:DNA-directed RNA polymerase sigma subunit (sigma70/sigma32)